MRRTLIRCTGTGQFDPLRMSRSNEDWYSATASHPGGTASGQPPQPNVNGVRVCGAASQSTTGWCGEADRATNGSPALSYPSLNMACCMGC